VIQRGKVISNAIVAAAIAAVLLPAPIALAADAREADELKGEIRQLQVQVQALRSAMAELSELDRQEYYLVSRAPGGLGSSEAAPTQMLATVEPREPTPARVSADTAERPSRASKSRRHRHSSRSRSKSGRSSAGR
jgi:hypothetical protein